MGYSAGKGPEPRQPDEGRGMTRGRVRDVSTTLWLTSEEKRTVQDIAAWFGMNEQEYLRHAALGGTVEPPTLSERTHRRKGGAA